MDGERHNRLIEMFRARNTIEEIARELSLPIDEIEARLELLALTSTIHPL